MIIDKWGLQRSKTLPLVLFDKVLHIYKKQL